MLLLLVVPELVGTMLSPHFIFPLNTLLTKVVLKMRFRSLEGTQI